MLSCQYSSLLCIATATVAILLIGIAKAGFGGGVGLLSTPLLALVLPAKTVVGFLLPLMILADGFTIYHHRAKFDRHNLKILIPGAIIGIVLGTLLINQVSDVQLKRTIGVVVLAFLLFQLIRSRLFKRSGNFSPAWPIGTVVGVIAGFTSAIAHAAGPVITLFLLPQRLDKQTFVTTMVLFFAGVNLLKLIPYVSIDLITLETLKADLLFLPIVPIGTFAGAWMNKKISPAAFITTIYILVFITGVQLLVGIDLFSLFSGK